MQLKSAVVIRNKARGLITVELESGETVDAVSTTWIPPRTVIWVRGELGVGWRVAGR